MSTRPHNYGDDTSRRYRGVPVPIPRSSRETMAPPAVTVPELSLSTRGSTYPTSHVRKDSAMSNSLSGSQILHDVQERADVERDSTGHRKRSATSTNDQGSICPGEGEGIKMRDELHFKSPKEEDQHQCNRDRTDDKRDTPLGTRYPSLKDYSDLHRPPLVHAKDMETISASAGSQLLYEVQSRELDVLQHEHRVAIEENKALRNVNVSLRQQCEERAKKLIAARNERQIVSAQRKEIDDAYVALRQQYEEQMEELNAMQQERQAALEQKQKAEEDYAVLRQKYEAQNHGYSTLRNKYHSLKVILEQRTSELQSVQRFLTTADTFSGSEAVNTLRKLNEEVQQRTTFMAEWAVETFVFETPPPDQTVLQAAEQTRSPEALGVRLTQLLGTKKHRDNPILVEMAFRAYLIYELYWLASPWSIGQEEQSHNVYIDTIYQRMREAEGQAISGNWRALTRAYTLPACIGDPEFAHTIDTTIISGFSDILLAAGCTTSKPDVTSALWSKFSENIHHFVSLAGHVSKIIGVGVISEDFEVLVVSPDAVYDDKVMEDSYDNGDRVQGSEQHKEIVLCATELGLMQRMRVGAGTGQNGKPSELIVIKPKVALVSVIDIIDG